MFLRFRVRQSRRCDFNVTPAFIIFVSYGILKYLQNLLIIRLLSSLCLLEREMTSKYQAFYQAYWRKKKKRGGGNTPKLWRKHLIYWICSQKLIDLYIFQEHLLLIIYCPTERCIRKKKKETEEIIKRKQKALKKKLYYFPQPYFPQFLRFLVMSSAKPQGNGYRYM